MIKFSFYVNKHSRRYGNVEKNIDDFLKGYLGIEQGSVSADKKLVLMHETDTINKYNEAICHLYNILRRCYFKNGIMLYGWNDYLLTFDYAFDEIKSLYDYAEKHNIKSGYRYIGNFLLSFQFSIESQLYKSSHIHNKLRESFYKCFSRSDFYNDGKFVQNSIDYLNDLITSKEIIFDINFYLDNIAKLFDRSKRDNKYHLLFDSLLEKKKWFSKLFDYDYDCNRHEIQYNEYVVYNAHEFKWNNYKFESALSLAVKLYNKQILNKKSYVEILNRIIIEINEVIEGYNGRLDNAISFISNIDQILSALNKIKKCHDIYKCYEEKIEHCINSILYCKRNYVKNEDIDSKMSKIKYEFEIDEKIFDEIQKVLSKGYQNVFSCLKIDFDATLENAIVSHSDHPLTYLFPQILINTDLGIYDKWNENPDSVFSLYYNEEGKDIVDRMGDKLVNVYSGDFYYLMVRHISMNFSTAGQLLIFQFKDLFEANFREYICNRILRVKGEVYRNDYVLCVHLITCIERLIYEQIIKIRFDFDQNKMSSNLGKLFSYYKRDKFSRDVYMYVNYILYDKLGMKYRNNFMHGNFIHKKDLTIELLYIFSCVIGLIVVGKRNEN